jgi:hypothetical protein
MEQIEDIRKDILEKLAEVKDGSHAQKFLLIKKKVLDDCIQTIIDEAQINKYEYELYALFEKCEILRHKINMKDRRPTVDDEDIKALREAQDQILWTRQSKLRGVKLTPMSWQLQ